MAIKAKQLQPAKTKAIEETKEVFQNYNDFIFANYRGLTVEQITELRNQLRAKNCEFKVVKNNFARVAFEEMKIDNVAEYLAGPTAVAMVKEDSNEVAKVMFDFSKIAKIEATNSLMSSSVLFSRNSLVALEKFRLLSLWVAGIK